MTEIYLHIVARMADYMDTQGYKGERRVGTAGGAVVRTHALCPWHTPPVVEETGVQRSVRVRVQLIGHARNNM